MKNNIICPCCNKDTNHHSDNGCLICPCCNNIRRLDEYKNPSNTCIHCEAKIAAGIDPQARNIDSYDDFLDDFDGHERTTDEIQYQFIQHVKSLIKYWNNQKNQTTEQKLEGLAFSMLVTLDGGTEFPQFIVAPNPHPEDKSYHQSHGGDWYPENHDLDVKGNIAGCLHELLVRK